MDEEGELAVRLIREHFGFLPSTVVKVLLDCGASTLEEILVMLCTKYQEVPGANQFAQVRNTLLTLIQHNIVDSEISFSYDKTPTAETLVAGENPSGMDGASTHYKVNMDQTLWRLRYPRFTLFVEAELGPVARHVFVQILRCGRVSLPAAVHLAAEDYAAHALMAEDEEEDTARNVAQPQLTELKESALQQAFLSLLTGNFIQRVDDLSTQYRKALDRNQPTKAGTKGKKTTKRQAAPAAAQPKRKKRRRNGGGEETDAGLSQLLFGENAGDAGANKGSRKADNNHIVPEAAPPQTAAAESDYKNKKKNKQLLQELIASRVPFCVNSTHINHELCKRTVEDFMTTRWVGARSVRLVTRALLTGIHRSGDGTGDVHCRSLLFSEVETLVHQYEKEDARESTGRKVAAITRATILKLLDVMSRHADRVVRQTQKDGHPVYSLDWDQLRFLLRRRTCFLLIQSRLGALAARVWMLTVDDSNMLYGVSGETGKPGEEDTPSGSLRFWDDVAVSEAALLPPSSAREQLFLLAQNGFTRAHQSDVVSHAPASTSGKHGLVFRTDPVATIRKCLALAFVACLNLFERKEMESARILQMYLRVSSLNPTDVDSLRQRETAEDILENHCLLIDDTLILLRDF